MKIVEMRFSNGRAGILGEARLETKLNPTKWGGLHIKKDQESEAGVVQACEQDAASVRGVTIASCTQN